MVMKSSSKCISHFDRCDPKLHVYVYNSKSFFYSNTMSLDSSELFRGVIAILLALSRRWKPSIHYIGVGMHVYDN